MADGKPYVHQLRHKAWQRTLPDMIEDAPFAEIASRIRWHRAVERLSQAEYARKAGVNRSQLSNWESGQQRVSVDGALALRETYGLSLDFIYAGNVDTLPMTLRAAWRDSPAVSASR